MSEEFGVPDEWLEYADELDQLAATLRSYLELEDGWAPGSVAASEKAHEPEFAALPFKHPVSTTLIHPRIALGLAMDHVVAMAAVLRTERTIFALLTLLRPVLVAAGMAYFLADPSIDVRERVRRAMNVELKSATEMMRFYGSGTEGGDDHSRRRRDLIRSAKTIWSTVDEGNARKGRVRVPFISPPPPDDMEWARQAMDAMDARDAAETIYRLLSATSHAQPHAVLGFLQPQAITPHSDGYSSARLAISQQHVVMWLLTTASALTGAVRRCCSLYGWDRRPWEAEVIPQILDWNRWLEAAMTDDVRRRTGLWLPGR